MGHKQNFNPPPSFTIFHYQSLIYGLPEVAQGLRKHSMETLETLPRDSGVILKNLGPTILRVFEINSQKMRNQ